jgi:hypothetical protein
MVGGRPRRVRHEPEGVGARAVIGLLFIVVLYVLMTESVIHTGKPTRTALTFAFQVVGLVVSVVDPIDRERRTRVAIIAPHLA